MFNTSSRRRRSFVAVSLAALLAPVALATSASAQAEIEFMFEDTTEADLRVPHRCDDGSFVNARLVVRTNRLYESPDTEDTTPTATLLYQAVCNGLSFTWTTTRPAAATITSTPDLKSVTAAGTGTVRTNTGVIHTVDFDVAWTGVGPVQTTTGPIQRSLVGTSIDKRREATMAGVVALDGQAILDGQGVPRLESLQPFIRSYEERYTRPN